MQGKNAIKKCNVKTQCKNAMQCSIQTCNVKFKAKTQGKNAQKRNSKTQCQIRHVNEALL
jgi:hypothetical protein